MLRIEIIPVTQLASISSLIILFNQLILPIVGDCSFLYREYFDSIYIDDNRYGDHLGEWRNAYYAVKP